MSEAVKGELGSIRSKVSLVATISITMQAAVAGSVNETPGKQVLKDARLASFTAPCSNFLLRQEDLQHSLGDGVTVWGLGTAFACTRALVTSLAASPDTPARGYCVKQWEDTSPNPIPGVCWQSTRSSSMPGLGAVAKWFATA